MPSFELKPMGSTNDKQVGMGSIFLHGGAAMANAIPQPHDIVWTCPRRPLPPQLQGRVPETVWEATFDAVALRVAEQNELQVRVVKAMSGPMIPCCVPCILCKAFASLGNLQAAQQQSEQAWLTLAQNEQGTYAPYGIHVTLATEMRVQTSGSGSMRDVRSSLVNVGLKFEAADFPMPSVEGSAVVVATVPVPHEIDRTDMTSELEKLANLHQKGALTNGEFATAKAKLLG